MKSIEAEEGSKIVDRVTLPNDAVDVVTAAVVSEVASTDVFLDDALDMAARVLDAGSCPSNGLSIDIAHGNDDVASLLAAVVIALVVVSGSPARLSSILSAVLIRKVLRVTFGGMVALVLLGFAVFW